MASIIEPEYYRKLLGKPSQTWDVEEDAAEAEKGEEEVYEEMESRHIPGAGRQ